MNKKRNILQRGISKLAVLGIFNILSDKSYLKLVFWGRTGSRLNLKNPRTFNEKLQWLKLYYRKPEMSVMVDKYEVKKYVSKIIGEEYIIPTLGVWNNFEDIDFTLLPNQFVLKCTHDSGGLVICKDKSKLDLNAARNKINKSLKTNYYMHGREWPYKNVKPRIIAEEFMTDETGIELKDYKVFNFNGIPKMIQVDYDRFSVHKRNLYTTDWNYINAELEFPTDANRHIDKPEKLTEMLELASHLSEGFPHLRTDFYSVGNKIYFGELTFYHGGGFEHFSPKEFEREISEYIKLPC
jgi:hypothetical protein